MTFYFKPPRGEIQFHCLQECLEERLSYLRYVSRTSDISDCNECFKFEYLTDGSALDRTGHFMLRILSIKLVTLMTFFLKSETLLFEKRLKHLGYAQVQQELKTALRHVREILSTLQPLSNCSQFLENFKKICEDILSTRELQHTFAKGHPQDCQQHSVMVPFTFCLSLIAAREVDLKGGVAIVHCGKWTKLLTDLFFEHIRHGIQMLSDSSAFYKVWADDRLQYLFQIIRAKFNDSHHPECIPSKSPKILAKEVDEKSSVFPPCMKNMHKTLRIRHRLSHYSRFYYSLFLKDVGMPLMESIEFWSQEYAQSTTSCSSCSHSWQRDSKRFSYSIRHLYGLEGSRREYRSPPCGQIQAMSQSPSSDGGCPFVGFDSQNLMQCLHEKVRSMKSFQNLLKDVNNNEGANAACKMYLKILLEVMTESNIKRVDGEEGTSLQSRTKDCLFSSPSQFYFISTCINKFTAK